MRILFVCTDAEIGGAERFLVSLAQASRNEDTVGIAVLMEPGELSTQIEETFDEVHYLGFPRSPRNLIGMVRKLKRVVRSFAPDVVSSHLFHADLVVALTQFSCPRTTTVHTQALGPDDHILTRLIARAVGLLSFRFDAVIPASSSSQMADFISSLRMKNVVDAIQNGASVPSAPAFSSASRQFISLARNHPVKGHKQLFKAFATIAADAPEWTLLAHGPGVTPDSQLMLAAISAAQADPLLAQGRIILGGPTSEPELALAKSAALVISSTYGEAFPIVGAEAAGLGLPVIATDLGSCSEFVDDRRFLVEPGSCAALATAMRHYVKSSDAERERLSRLARSRAEERYHPQVAFEKYRTLFRSLIPSAPLP